MGASVLEPGSAVRHLRHARSENAGFLRLSQTITFQPVTAVCCAQSSWAPRAVAAAAINTAILYRRQDTHLPAGLPHRSAGAAEAGGAGTQSGSSKPVAATSKKW